MARMLLTAMLGAMVLAAPPRTLAQTHSAGDVPAGTQPSKPPSGPPLIIGSGDLISVSIFDAPELSGRFRVDQNGDLLMPLLDPMHVAGHTADEAAKQIEDNYVKAEILVAQGTHATVSIEEYTSQGITVSGEVKSPGVYPAFGVRMLNDVITAAGGSTDLASSNVIITRRGDPQHPITADYDPRAIPRIIPELQIFPGDTIFVPRAGIVYVLGAVNRAGGFPLNGHESVTAEKVLALAGGTTRAPSMKSAQLVRSLHDGRKEMITVNMDKILKGQAADIALKDGDILYIPTSTKKLATYQAINSALGIGTSFIIYKGLQ